MYTLLIPDLFTFNMFRDFLMNAAYLLYCIFGLVCRAGMTPNVTLHWFAHPQWFHELGEFQKEENISLFVEWAETAFKLFGTSSCMQALCSLVWQAQTAYEGLLCLSSCRQCMHSIPQSQAQHQAVFRLLDISPTTESLLFLTCPSEGQ